MRFGESILKKIFVALAMAVPAMAVEVAPLYFVDAQGDPIAANLQQEYWNYLVKYKLFGNDFVKTGNRVIIHDESGWTGSNGYFSAEQPDGQGTSVQTELGGPIVVAGKITTGDGYKFTTGPIRGGSFESGKNCNNCYYAAPICLDDKDVTGGGTAGFQAQPISNCPDQPSPNTAVSIPLLEWPASPTVADIKISANNGEQRIVVPDPVDGSKAPYDIYMDSILTGIGGTDGAKITVSMPAGGRVTRIFVHQIQLGNHTVIQIVYRTPQEDGSVVEVPAEKYVGNLLFYTDHDINIKNTDNSVLLGTYISTGRIFLQSNINFAGQLIANELVVGNEFDGRSFVFVPIDPPVLDLKPQADTPLEFPENDLLVKVPIALDTPAPADVFIDYCFDLQNSSAKESDFKLEDGYSYPKSKGHLFPICGQDMGKVTILKDAKTPADAPDVSVWINVAKDELVERPNETLRLKITNISGAVLPGNKLDGYFDLIIVDANVEPTSENFEITATEDEVFTFDSSMFKYESAFDKVEQGVVIMSLPEKGFLLTNGDTLTSSDLNKFIPINETTNVDLQFIAAKDEYGVTPAYTSFTFKMKDADNVVSENPYTVTVKVNPVNDKPTVTADTIKVGEVDHEVKSGSIAGADVENDALTYSFDDAFDATYTEANYNKITSLYEMDPATGVVSVKSDAVLNYESADSVLTIRVKVVDDAATTSGVGKDSAYAVVVLQIVDQNEAPVVRDTTFSVDENSKAGTEVGTLLATDPDVKSADFGVLKYSLVETDVPFAIDNQGVITVSEDDALDFETKSSWIIHVVVTDGYIPQTVTVTIDINDLNEPPHIDDILDQYNVVENSANGTPVTSPTIKITDPDAGDGQSTLSAKIEGFTASDKIAEQLFKATVATAEDGSLRIMIAVERTDLLDYEALLADGADTVSYDIRLILTDREGGTGSFADTAFTTIYVTDKNEKPTAEDGDFTIAENSDAGTVVGQVVASDPDTAHAAYGTLYYSFMTETTQFVIDEATGVITVAEGADLDFETTPDHKIKLLVAVTDNEYTEIATVVVTLTDVNEPPIIIDDGKEGYEVVENTAVTTEIARYEIKDVDAVDADFATSLKVSLKDNNTGNATLAESLFGATVEQSEGKTYAVIRVTDSPNFEAIMAANADSVFTVTLTVKDQMGVAGCNSVPLEKKIVVRDVNEAPVVADAEYSVEENSTKDTPVGTVVAMDEDTWSVLSYKLENIPGEGDVASLFNIDNSGKITVASDNTLDYETKNEYRVKVVVTDNGSDKGFENLSGEATVVIHVTDVDEKPGFDDKNPVFAVFENSKASTDVGTVSATDDDCKDNTCATLTYTLVADTVAANANDYKEFKIDASTGKITVAKDSTLNYEVDSLYYALVVVDDGTLTDTARVTINIKDANDRPVIKNKTLTVPENSQAGTVVGTVPAKDEDAWSVLTYKLADVNSNDQVAQLFKVDNNGEITVAKDSTLDYEGRNEYQVWVVVTDNGASRGFENLSDTALVTIKVSDVNEPPEFIDDGKPSYKVAENTATGIEIARYEIKDPDAADANFATNLKVSLADNNTQNSILAQNLFNIKVETRNDSTFAVIRVASVPDFEAIKEANGDTLFNVTLTLKDQNGAAGCNEVTLEKKIYVSDVNEKPSVDDAEFDVDENSKKGDSVGVVVARDPDVLNPNFGTLYYSLIDSTKDAAKLFNIDNKGKITVAANADLDYEDNAVIYVKVVVTDKQYKDTATVKINLNDVDETPKIIVDDDDDGDDDTDSLCVANCDTTGRGSDPSKPLTVAINENSATGTVVFEYVVYDEDEGDLEKLVPTIEHVSANVDDSKIKATDLFEIVKVKDGKDSLGNDKWKISVRVKDSALLDYEALRQAKSNSDPNPRYTVNVIISEPDGYKDGLKDTILRVIEVRDVNESPLFDVWPCEIAENNQIGDSVGRIEHPSDIDSLARPENVDFYDNQFKLVGGDTSLFALEYGGPLNIKLVAKVEFDCENGIYKCEEEGAYKVILDYFDKQDPSIKMTKTIPITLRDVNELPVITTDVIEVAENSKKETIVDTVKAEDVDVYDSVLTYTLVEDNSKCFDIGKNSGVVTVKTDNCAALDYEKNTTLPIKVKVSDTKGGSDTKTITVKVNDVNEPPHITDQTITVSEDYKVNTVVDTVKADDPDKDPKYRDLTYTAIDGDTTVFEVDAKTGELILKDTLDYERQKEYSVVVRVDDGEFADTATVKIKVKNVEEKTDVVIIKYEDPDTSYSYPDTVFTNKSTPTITWVQEGDTLTMDTTLTPGKNVIVITYRDPTKDFPGSDTVVVFYSTASPEVIVSANADEVEAKNIYTIVEKTNTADTNIYVNDTKNDIRVTIRDSVTKTDSTFVVKLDLDTLQVSNKVYDKLDKVIKESIALNETPSRGVVKTPTNGVEIQVAYKEVIGGDTVEVAYRTDIKGDVVKTPVVNAKGEVDSIEVITVSYYTEVKGKTVKVSYQADAVTGALLVQDAEGNLMSESTASKSSKNKKGRKSTDAARYQITYEYEDAAHNTVVVTYGVDEKGALVTNAEGDKGYSVSYTYVNKYGNAATQSVYIVLDQVGPSVEILSPEDGSVIRSNFVNVVWTVNGEEQDTLTVQGLEKGANVIVRFYRDKAGNEASDTIFVVMKDGKDVDIAVERPVTEITKDKVDEYYASNPPEPGQTFAVSIRNPSTGTEVETLVGGSFKTKKGSGEAPYPGLEDEGHLGPTLDLEIKLPTVSDVGGLATMDDLLSSDGLVPLDGVDAENSDKLTVESYVKEYCEDGFKITNNLEDMNLYQSKMDIKIWIYTSLGSFVDYFSFTQDLNDASYPNEAGLLQMFFEMKPDKDGNMRTEDGRLYATGAYLYKVEAKIRSKLRCTLPPVKDESGKKKGDLIKSDDDLLKPFGYKRPNE